MARRSESNIPKTGMGGTDQNVSYGNFTEGKKDQ